MAFKEHRQREELEGRIVAGQAEFEPEATPRRRSQWPGWTCDDACRWMLDKWAFQPLRPRPVQRKIASVAGMALQRPAPLERV